MRTPHAAAASALVLAGAALTFGGGEASDPSAPRLVCMTIAAPNPEKPDESYSLGQRPGVQLTFRVAPPGAVILGLDEDASKLVAFADDQGNALTDGRDWLWTFPRVAEDKRSCSFELHAPRVPAPGAREVRVQATVALKLGSEPKSAEQADVVLAKGTQVTVGPVPFKVGKVGKPDWGDGAMAVDLESERDLDAVSSMEFVAPDGHVIESGVTSSMGFSMNGKGSFTRSISLKEQVSRVTLRLKWFAKVESRPFPVDGRFGVGF